MMKSPRKYSSIHVAVLPLVALCVGLSSCGSGKAKIPGVENFDVGVVNRQLFASFVSTTLNLDGGITGPIPGLKGATYSVTPYLPIDGSAQTGTLFSFSVGLDALGSTNYSIGGLPDGRDLPDVQGGKLPRWTFKVQSEDIYVYMADEAFAIFVPIKLATNGVSLNAIISAKISDERGNQLGKVYAIPSVANGSSSGLLLLLPFPGHSGSLN